MKKKTITGFTEDCNQNIFSAFSSFTLIHTNKTSHKTLLNGVLKTPSHYQRISTAVGLKKSQLAQGLHCV